MMNAEEILPIKLSIVIAAWNGRDYLQHCLKSLEKQADVAGVEVIVVSNFGLEDTENAQTASFVNYILADQATVPELRTRGIQQARGEIIALLEDHCEVDPEWTREICKAHALPFQIVGGAVENISPNLALNWAVYFYDYGNYMLPSKAGAAETLSGMNVSYKREMLAAAKEVYADGFFETFVNEKLKQHGHKLYFAPSAIVYHRKDYNFKTVTTQFYHQARSFAAQRKVNLSFPRRILFVLAACLLPILLPVRTVARTLKKNRHLGKLMAAVPCLVILLTVWAAGEFCGYLFGAGESADYWR